MHGVPRNLRLRKFVGFRLLAVDDLENIVYLRFARDPSLWRRGNLSIGIEAQWQLSGPSLSQTFTGCPNPSPSMVAAAPLGEAVTSFRNHAPTSFTLLFQNGVELSVFDSNAEFESFSIPELNVYV
jgi:hypothetical protein